MCELSAVTKLFSRQGLSPTESVANLGTSLEETSQYELPLLRSQDSSLNRVTPINDSAVQTMAIAPWPQADHPQKNHPLGVSQQQRRRQQALLEVSIPRMQSNCSEAGGRASSKGFNTIHTSVNRVTNDLYAAVECRNMRYDLGLGPLKKTILHNINITVPEGSIYALLGPSGCGKTTVLKCVVGRITPKKGIVRVFGYKSNEPGSNIPGPAIGYMPQEISVYESFTIDETLRYFGKICRMKNELLNTRIEFLINFLNLPESTRMVSNLSGGQKRRVSLAAAMIHSPPLLILDEPTVGVDPLLRQSIWKHLVTLAQREKTSIIITTHYIEESRQAHTVGLMRHGQLLAEDGPESLMNLHGLDNLEDVFLKLCVSDDSRRAAELANSSVPVVIEVANDREKKLSKKSQNFVSVFSTIDNGHNNNNNNNDNSNSNNDPGRVSNQTPVNELSYKFDFVVNKSNLKSMKPGQKYPPSETTVFDWTNSLIAVIWKNYISLKRKPSLVVFEFILPAVQVILFCLCIGRDPFDVPVAVVNEDKNILSNRFLNLIGDSRVIRLVEFPDTFSAIESVRRGKNLAVIHIPGNYSFELLNMFKKPSLNLHNFTSADSKLNNVTISVFPDLTNLHLALAVENTLRTTFKQSLNDSLEILGYDKALLELPVKVEAPIYGSILRNGYLEFMTPGVVISITYVMATGLTALAFILEKKDGMLERSMIAGISTSQILLAHAAIQIVVMIFQVGILLVFIFIVFDIPSNGPISLAALLVLLQGATGMVFGLLVSAVCKEENTAVMMLVGTFYTSMILAGIIWPVEALPHYLRWISLIQPQTLPTEALRHILSRGWGIGEVSVQIGFAVTIAWLLIFLVISGLIMKHTRI